MPFSGSVASHAPPPSLRLLGLEPLRAAFEYASMRLAPRAAHPRGDGHPVFVFPGLASDQRAIAPLTRFCRSLGYASQDWGRGFNTGPHGDTGAWLDRLADETARLADMRTAALQVAPAVPTTAIYSRSDGVVAWQTCIQPDGHDQVEYIEVEGSHCGLGWNTRVLAIIADRLGQPEGRWEA